VKVVIAEKEEAARRIADLLGGFREVEENGVTYFAGGDYVIVPARGHIINPTIRGLRQTTSLDELPKLKVAWRVEKSERDRYVVIRRLVKEADDVIVATDWDREGEVIGYNLVRFTRRVRRPSRIKRAYFSSLTLGEVKKAIEEPVPMNEALLTQGLARNLADAIIGLNLTKALTLLFRQKHPNLEQAVTLGRVQSPLLAYIKKKTGAYIERENRVSNLSYSERKLYIDLGDKQYELRLPTEPVSDYVEIIDVNVAESLVPQAEKLFNTDDVMRASKISPEATMSIMESLYLKGYLTYPRTTSRYVRNTEFLAEIEREIRRYYELPESFTWKNTPVELVEEAHPDAILLTPEGVRAYFEGRIKGREKFIATIVLARTIRSFAPPLKKKAIQLRVRYEGLNGVVEETVPWSEEYENVNEAISLISFTRKPVPSPGKYRVIKITSPIEKVTSYGAFKSYVSVLSDTDLVSWMADVGIGTEATRQIFPSLLRDERHNYTDECNLPRTLGEVVGEIIEKELKISPSLTSRMERRINSLKRLRELEGFIEEVAEYTRQLIEKMKAINIPDLTCPRCNNKAELVNRYSRQLRRNILLLYCGNCKKHYEV
jgi:DNA topoisomerase-1